LEQGSAVHIFERGLVEPDSFRAALARAEQGDWYLSTLLGVEAWLRALEPGGQMARLIPARAPSGSRGG